MTREQYPTTTTSPSSEQSTRFEHSGAVAIKSPQPQRPLRSQLPTTEVASLLSSCNDGSASKSNGAGVVNTDTSIAHVKENIDHKNQAGVESESELLKCPLTIVPKTALETNGHNIDCTPHTRSFTLAEDLMQQSMALRKDFESRHSPKHAQGVTSQRPFPKSHAKKPSFSAPFVPFSQELPAPEDTPTQGLRQPQTPFISPRRSLSFDTTTGGEDMTPAQSPESSDDEDDKAELELSVGRLGLGRNMNGGNSPANERVESEKSVGKDSEGTMKTGYELSLEDQAILERAAKIMARQVRHFEGEINANIHQQVKDLYRDSLDPPDIADMDSMPDFHIRRNPHAPNAIVKTVQVCCAVERGLAAILRVQRGTEKKMGKGEGKEESLMETCVRRPVVVGKEMQSAVNGIAKTVGYGGREKRGDSVEWKV